MKWQDEWPKEKGFYWLYGRRFRSDKVKIHFVEVWKSANNIFMYVSEGGFLYPKEGAEGKWQKVKLPELPK